MTKSGATPSVSGSCGSPQPLTVLALSGGRRLALLGAVWGGAALGVAFRLAWTDAPRPNGFDSPRAAEGRIGR